MKYKEQYLSVAVIAVSLMISFGIINAATAQNITNVQYPVAELGNCENKASCKTYCDTPEHMQACVAFAKKNKLMSDREIKTAEKFIAAGAKGPGGCRGKGECEAFCDNINHIDECVLFAEKNDMMPAHELEEAKKVQSAIKRGVRPPACKNKKECDTYCSQTDHMEECVAFAEAAGFMKEEELVEARKVLSAIKRGVKPPACHGKEECDVYCSQDAHFEECILFAEAAGFMKPEEVQMVRKTGGKGPGGCRGSECEAFCSNPANQEACFAFAEEHGLMKEEDLRRMEEGKDQMMRGFEQAPPEVRECLNASLGSDFVEKVKSGSMRPSMDIGEKMQACFEKMRPQEGQMMQPGELRPEEFGRQQEGFREGIMGGQAPAGGQMPPEVIQCLLSSAGAEAVEQMKSGQSMPSPEMEEKIRSCFEQYGKRESQQLPPDAARVPFGDGQMMPDGFRKDGLGEPMQDIYRMAPQEPQKAGMGPGGCTGPEECRVYCQTNPQECGSFAPPTYPTAQPTIEGQFIPEGFPKPPLEGQMPPAGYQLPPPPTDGNYMPPAEFQSGEQSGKVMPLLNRIVHGFYRLIGIE